MILAFISVLAIAAGLAYWLASRNRASDSDRVPPRAKPAGGRFGAVEIRVRNSACQAARSLQSQRFLAKEAPALPLPGCSVAPCNCKFTKWSDRRSEHRRLEHGGLSASIFLANNRRMKRERRRAAQARQR
jgi:hypothetical protein